MSFPDAGGVGTWLGMELEDAGSSCDTQKTGWTAHMLSESQRVKECVPGLAIISYGPIFLSESFWDRHVVCKNLVEFLMEFIELDCEFLA